MKSFSHPIAFRFSSYDPFGQTLQKLRLLSELPGFEDLGLVELWYLHDICLGMSPQECAKRLEVSEWSVTLLEEGLLKKMGAPTILELKRMGYRYALEELDFEEEEARMVYRLFFRCPVLLTPIGF